MSSKRSKIDSTDETESEDTTEEEEEEEEGPTPRRHPAQSKRSKKATSQPRVTPPRNSIIIRGINAAKDVKVTNCFEQRLPDPAQTHSAVQGTGKGSTSVLIEGVKTGGAVYAGSFLNNLIGGNAATSRTATANSESESSASKGETLYTLQSPGNVLIIKNAFIENTFSIKGIKAKRYRECERRGTQKDFKDMKTLFENDLGCIVNEDPYVRKDGLPDTLNKFKQACIDAGSSFLVVIFITYGGPGNVLRMQALDKISPFEDIVSQFSEDAFPEFKRKPKIFLTQTCTNFTDREQDAVALSLPEEKLTNIFVGGAFVPCGLAWRRPVDGDGPANEEGGWYLQSVKDVFGENWRDQDVKAMHDRVEEKVVKIARTENLKRQEGDRRVFQRPYKFCSQFDIFQFPPPAPEDY